MIRKLRLKLIVLSMTAFLVVLAVIIGAINVINFRGVIRETDILLEILSDNKGKFPHGPGDKFDQLSPGMSPETPYETRFFSVTVNAETGAIIQVETSRIAAVDTERAISLSKTALEKQSPRGSIGTFRYCVRTEGNTTRITFLDMGRKLDASAGFLWISIGISAVGYLTVLILITFFSGRIIRPISESYEKQKRFITDASHEIKTPLTIISADTDVLEMECGESEWLADIREQTRRLTGLTNNLVMLSRMEEAENDLQMIDFSFSDAVSESAAAFRTLAHAQGKTLNCRIQPLLTLNGNEKNLRQLVSILLDNALKYSGENAEIAVTAEKQNKNLRLTVSNPSGYPIPKESLPLLFDRFYRADPSRNSQTGGYGIGLSVARAIVTAHGGKIQASAEGDILTITATFPT